MPQLYKVNRTKYFEDDTIIDLSDRLRDTESVTEAWILLYLGADPHREFTIFGSPFLHHIKESRSDNIDIHKDIIKAMMAFGADPMVTNRHGSNALVYVNDLEDVKVLVHRYPALLYQKDDGVSDKITDAIEYGHIKRAVLFYDLTKSENKGEAALLFCVTWVSYYHQHRSCLLYTSDAADE